MRFDPNDVVVFAPGLLGFGSFGPKERPLLRYFEKVSERVAKELGVEGELRAVFHEPPPTGSLASRVESMARTLDAALSEEAWRGGPPPKRVHVVGHSTGGVDAELLLNPAHARFGGPSPRERAAISARVGAVVTICAPFDGAPFAPRAKPLAPSIVGAFPKVLGALTLASILSSLAHAKEVGGVRRAIGGLLRFAAELGPGTERLASVLGLVDGIDAETTGQIRRFLELIEGDRALLDDLAPSAMRDLRAEIAHASTRRLHAVAAVAPRPSRFPLAPSKLAYAVAWRFARPDTPSDRVAALKRGAVGVDWIGGADASELLDDEACDGVVPTASQTPAEPMSRALVRADHLDVIGHFEGLLEPVMSSGAAMTPLRFEALHRHVARAIRGELG